MRLLRSSILVLTLLAVLPAGASAATPEFLWRAPADGKAGTGAGQINRSTGIAADPESGHVYVADGRNARVVELDAWGQFVKAWGWGVADGSNELQTCGPEANPPTAACLKGIGGSGPGQFNNEAGQEGPSGGIAVDLNGDVYVGDMLNHRVQKFDSDGNFLLMFGGGVNKGPNRPGNVCTATHIDDDDVCGAGVNAAGDGQFLFGSNGSHIVVGPSGTIFVGDFSGRIQEFEPNGAFKSKVVLGGELAAVEVVSLAIDASGVFYLISPKAQDRIYKISPAGALLSTIAGVFSQGSPLALDAEGNLYAIGEEQENTEKGFTLRREVIAFGPDGAPTVPAGAGFEVQEETVGLNNGVKLQALATNAVTADAASDVYVGAGSITSVGISFINAYGAPPDKWDPPAAAPEIISQYALSANSDSAVLGAEINPQFWADTSYYVEYGTGKCSEGGCTTLKPAPPGVQLGAGVTAQSVKVKGVFLGDLAPNTTYHYRFVAQSGGGGPVRGVGGKVGADGAEGTFTTPRLSTLPNTDCSNAALRSAASAHLPDCRAYELVSPIDKNGADVVGLCNIYCARTEINQAALDGEKFTYSSYKAFGDAISGPFVNQYISSRGPEGWASHGISPPFASGIGIPNLFITEPEFKAFTPDLESGWIVSASRLPLTPDAVEGFANVYRQGSSSGDVTTLTRSEPLFAINRYYGLEFQGRSADGAHTLFTAEAALTPGAAPEAESQLYAFSGGELHLVSVRPDGSASTGGSTAGTKGPTGDSTHGYHQLEHAISEDGLRVFWSDSTRKLYVRVNPAQTQSTLEAGTGKCKQPAKACTFPVSSVQARFWSADPKGSKALFSEGPTENEALYEFDVSTKKATLIASQVPGVLGASEDLSRIYFVSRQVLGLGASAGANNLYVSKDGTITHIATLGSADVGVTEEKPSSVNPMPVKHMARVTSDGSHIAFMSTNGLTGYDNLDADNGKAAFEVFTYDADAEQLDCVSCDPTGARPEGEALKLPYSLKGSSPFETNLWAAAWLNTSETSLYTPRVLSEDGDRLFFNAFDALLPQDTNGAQDVYQWERPGSGDCTTESLAYSPPNGGCLALISSGKSPQISEFVDATPDGSDVFFKTAASLDPRDPGLIDVYDARVGGGFPPPPVPEPPCVGDACQSVPSPPGERTPASEGFRGVGDPPKARCPKGKRRVTKGGKSRCVVRKQRKHKRNRPRQSDRRVSKG
jgi:hypothetical protein